MRRLYNIPGQPPDMAALPPGCKFAARCRYVQARCRAEEPVLADRVDGHFYRCFFPVDLAASGGGPDVLPDLAGLPDLADLPGPAAGAGAGAAAQPLAGVTAQARARPEGNGGADRSAQPRAAVPRCCGSRKW